MPCQLVYVHVNHNSRKLALGKFAVRQGTNRENKGNLKMQYFLVCSFGKYMEKWQFSGGYGQIGVYSRDAIFDVVGLRAYSPEGM